MDTVISGWDVVCALLVVLAAVVVERTVAPRAVSLTTLFGVALVAFALLVRF